MNLLQQFGSISILYLVACAVIMMIGSLGFLRFFRTQRKKEKRLQREFKRNAAHIRQRQQEIEEWSAKFQKR